MIKTILKYLLVLMVISLLALWLWQGGARAIAEQTKNFNYEDPFSFFSFFVGGEFSLPGQPEFSPVPDTSIYGEGDITEAESEKE